jgi:thiamine-monophosphate kinase
MTKRATRAPSGGEFELIAQLARELSTRPTRNVTVGIGDDAAVLRTRSERIVVSVDDQVEGVHFDRRWLTTSDVGFRSLQAAASDLAAMGARPLAAVASLHVPTGFPQSELTQLARGQAQAARALGCPVVGGNVARGPVLSVTTTVLGEVSRPLLRSAARAGDELWVVGRVGFARAGLLLHQQRLRVPRRLARVAAQAKQAWARPEALIAAGLALHGRARAAIDVSDGLAGDAQQLARASGVKAVLRAELLTSLVSPELADLADLLGEPGAALALRGGEDYALLCTGRRALRPAGARVIGRVEIGRGAELELETGQRFALDPGFDHLRA